MAKRKRGGGGLVGRVLIFVVVLSFLGAWLKTPQPMSDYSSPMAFFEAKSDTVNSWAQRVSNDGLPALLEGLKNRGLTDELTNAVKNPAGGSKSPGGSKDTGVKPSESKSDLQGVTIAEAQSVDYDRDEWKHWSTAPGAKSCWNVREEVLYRDSDPGALVLKDSSGATTTNKSKACSVEAGKWVDPYSGNVITNPSKIDIDHMIPLSYAAQHGGQEWSSTKKEDFANSLTNPNHLVASSATENRRKGDKGPSEYRPKTGECSYAQNWISVASQWNISASSADKKALEEMLATC